MGAGDKERDGVASEFEFKNGPGARMKDEEVEKVIGRGPTDRAPHPAHVGKKDFDVHGYTDRCPGCSTILRGVKLQPQSDQCKKNMAEVLQGDARVENAKRRAGDYQRKREKENDVLT